MRATRWRAALAASALLLGAAPTLASALAPALTCRNVTTVAGWQRIPVAPFNPIQGVPSADHVSGYSIAPGAPQYVAVTNGKQVKVSATNGCSWRDGLTLGLTGSTAVPLTGITSTVVATAALPRGRVLAAVQEGLGVASRPHVVASDNGTSGYATADSGLPPLGTPRLLEAADDGRTVYLVLSATGRQAEQVGGVDVPGAPDAGNPVSGAKTGLLYASTDGGRSWELRTSAADLPGGGGGLDSLAIDHSTPSRLFAVSNGRLLVSVDGGRTFTRQHLDNEDVTAVETGPGGYVVVFTAGGRARISFDGRTFFDRPAPPGVTSAAYRGTGELAVEAHGHLSLLDLSTGIATGVAGLSVTPGSLVGDLSSQATYHALSGHSLLRYSDPEPKGGLLDGPAAVGDLPVPAPPPGTITPGTRTVQLKVGSSTTLDYSLALPKSRTPLDLMFLVDTSPSMENLIEDLKKHISKATGAIQSAGIDLRVGIATLGTGPQQGTVAAPGLDPTSPTDGGPKLYELLAPVGPVSAFAPALAKVKTHPAPDGAEDEAQVIALEQVTAGQGVHDPRVPNGVPVYLVQPGQSAHWRDAPGIRRLVVHATDEAFAKPMGTRMKNGKPDIQHAVDLMNRYGVKQLGLSMGSPDAQADLAKVAGGTQTFAPPGGADCGLDFPLRGGAPLVCDTDRDFSAVVGQLVRDLSDRQRVQVVARGTSPKVLRSISTPGFGSVDVTVPNTLPFKVTVSCVGQSVGRYSEDVVASLRSVQVASSRLTVDCLGPAAAAAALRPPPAPAVPADPPAAPPPASVVIVPAPPAAQAQVPQAQSQAQTQAQVNPMTAAAMQQQEELQLALALQDDQQQPETGTELAMVGRRRSDEGAAVVLLAAAMVAASGLGLARLRSRPEPSVARVRP